MEKLKQLFSKNTDKKFQILLVIMQSIALLFCQANSPLFAYNDYADLAIYTVIGRAIRNGQVLYRDVYDHKGPIFFLLQQIFYYNEFTVWILDLITFAVSQIFLYKTIRYFKDSVQSLGCTIFVIGVELLFLWDAGSPEQVFMMLLYISMYMIVSGGNRIRDWVIWGLMVSYCFYSKINIVFMFIPIFFYLSYKQITDKDIEIKGYFKRFGCGLLVFLSMTAIVLGYFGINGAINDFINVYFGSNSGYMQTVWKSTFSLQVGIALIILTIVLWLMFCKKEKDSRVAVIMLQICSLLFGEIVISGHVYVYYLLLAVPSIQLIFLNKKEYSILLKEILVIFSQMFYVLACINFVQMHDEQFLGTKESDLRYQFYIDASETAADEGNDSGIDGVMTLFEINNNLAYYLDRNDVKYSTFCNMTYKTNPEMYEYALDKIQNKQIEYVALQFGTDGSLITNFFYTTTDGITNKIIDAVAENYELYNTYKIDDENNLRVYRVKQVE